MNSLMPAPGGSKPDHGGANHAQSIILFRPHAYGTKLLHEAALVFGTVPLMGPPNGILYVAAPLVAHNYKVILIDEAVTFEWEAQLARELPKALCVGISAMTGEQLRGGIKFAQAVRRFRDIPIIWGGVHVTALPEESLRSKYVDAVVVGEGEATFLEMVQALEQGKTLSTIPGCGFKTQDRIVMNPPREAIAMDSIPEIPYHLLDMEKYLYADPFHLDNQRTFELHTSRGCAHGCKFCATSCLNRKLYQKVWRSKSLEKIKAEITSAMERFKFDGLRFREDNFFQDESRVREICNFIIASGFKFKWYGTCRADYWNAFAPEFVELMKQAGLGALGIGIESGSARILKLINKGITVEDILAANRKIDKYKVNMQYSIMFSFPTETYRDVADTVNILYELSRNPRHFVVGPIPYLPYPGSPFVAEARAAGEKLPGSLEEWAEQSWQRYRSPDEPAGYEKFYNNIKVLADYGLRVTRAFKPVWYRSWFRFRLFLIGKLKWSWTAFWVPEAAIIRWFQKVKRSLKASQGKPAGQGAP